MQNDHYRKWLMEQKLSRRGLLRASAVAAAGGGLALAGCTDGNDDNGAAGVTPAASGGSPQPPATLEQQTQRRRGTGLIGWNRDKAYDGYTLFAPEWGDGTFYLIDMAGKAVHTWSMPYQPGKYGYLLPNGNLFYIGYKPAGDASAFVWKGGVIQEVDWDGKALWEFEHPDQHHDGRLLPNGNLLLLCSELTPPDVAARIPGGQRVEGDDRTWSDYVVEVTREGEVVWEWHAWQHMKPEDYPRNPQDLSTEWTHGNSVEGLPDGSVLVSFRHTNTVAIIDRQTGAFTWELGADEVAQQHAPTLLPSGNILIFDNGSYRAGSPAPYSRVIEVEPASKEIVWAYLDLPRWNFFSPFVSGAQRLPGGNTLITEGCFGRLFEVTAEKEVVWEYVSPFFAVSGFLGETNQIFRAYRYAPDEVPQLRT